MKRRLFLCLLPVLAIAFSLYACGGGGGGGATAIPPFSQTNLVGTWFVSTLQTGPAVSTGLQPGWIRGVVHIVSSGSVSAPELYTSASPTTPIAGPSGIVWKINPWTGLISETVGTSPTDFHGKLASNKALIAGPATGDGGAIQLRVLQKIDSAATCMISDIAAKTFRIHQIESGASRDWMHVIGLTDPVVSEGTTTLTLTVVTKPSGTGGPVSPGLLSIDATGFVSLDANPSFQGLLSPDRTYMIATETDPDTGNIYRLTVAQIIDPAVISSYSVMDLAGTWSASSILTGGAWLYGTPGIDAAGNLKMKDQHDNLGNPSGPVSTALHMVEPGVYSDPTNTTSHSFLSSTKDFLVLTQTINYPPAGGEQSALSILIK